MSGKGKGELHWGERADAFDLGKAAANGISIRPALTQELHHRLAVGFGVQYASLRLH